MGKPRVLAQRSAFQWHAIGIDNVHVMDSAAFFWREGPDHFLVRCDLKYFWLVGSSSVRIDYGIAVRQTLHAARIANDAASLFVSQFPYPLAAGVEFSNGIAVSQAD